MQAGSNRAAVAAEAVVGGFGLALIAAPLVAGQGWADRHFLPAWAWSWSVEMRILLVLRLALAAAGAAIVLFLRPWLAGAFRAGGGRHAVVSAVAALGATLAGLAAAEGMLHTRTWRSTQERWDQQQPLRERDPRIGWTFLPSHSGTARLGGRLVHYATDANGYRVRAPGIQTDFSKPSLILAGESVMLGYGLEWDETIPGRLERMTGLQAADIAVNAYSTDQALMRLERALPRFTRPVAVVMIFVPVLLDRNLDRDRPHLGPDLQWVAPERPPLRLVELARRITRYRSLKSMQDGIAMTRAALARTIALAGARGAVPIILVPQWGPESGREAAIRRKILDHGHIPYLLVRLDDHWRLRGDRHPDARADRLLAQAVAAAIAARRQEPVR
jgi:hypothetical protein